MAAYVIFNHLQVYDEEKMLGKYPKHASHRDTYGGTVKVRPGGLHMLEGPRRHSTHDGPGRDDAPAWYGFTRVSDCGRIREPGDVRKMIVPGV